MNKMRCVLGASAMLLFSSVVSCGVNGDSAAGGHTVPEGMVEVRPVMPGVFDAIQRAASSADKAATRTYDDNGVTDGKLVDNKKIRLPEGSTVWLIAKNAADGSYVKRSYAVYNPDDDEKMSYLVPCTVNDAGETTDMEGTPMYLKAGSTYMFYAVSPARKLDEAKLAEGQVAFRVRNGEAFYAHDYRYDETTPLPKNVESNNVEAVQEITLKPMINQTALLRFQIDEGDGVHDLDIQPSGIQISGLQNDSPDGVEWHMSQSKTDEPIILQHGNKGGVFHRYDYTIDAYERVNIEVPILPMRSLSKPVVVVFRLKVNGVPTSYEMMINEKDFKAGYSYGYRGKVSIQNGVDVIAWQYVSWSLDIEFPFI